MPWSTPIPPDNVVATHAALFPTQNGDGEILLFGGDNHYLHGNEINDFDHTQRFNCRRGAFRTTGFSYGVTGIVTSN